MGRTLRVFVTAGLLWACVAAMATGEQDGISMQQRSLPEALKDLTDRLMLISGILGTAEGLCDGKPCIKVFLTRKTPDLLRQIPTAVEGYPVAVEETGEFRPFQPPGR